MWHRLLHTSLLIISLLGLSPLRLFGQADRVYRPENVPNVQLSDSTQFLSDPNSYIDKESSQTINAYLQDLRVKRGIEFAVVVLPSIGNSSIEDFSNKLFRLWGLGDKKSNNGLLFILVVEDRKSRWEVGYGLEGYLTDASTASIWRNQMRRLVAQGRYGEAILSGIASVDTRLNEQGYIKTTQTKDKRNDVDFWGFMLGAYFILAFLGFGYIILDMRISALSGLKSTTEARKQISIIGSKYRRLLFVYCIFALTLGLLLIYIRRLLFSRIRKMAQQCPNCHQNTMQEINNPTTLTALQLLETKLGAKHYDAYSCRGCHYNEVIGEDIAGSPYRYCPKCGGKTAKLIKSTRYRKPSYGKIYRLNQYQCMYCHNLSEEDRIDEDANNNSDMLGLGAGLLLGAMSRSRGFSNGGFSGGSFGGGSSGGGGSTGSW